MLVRTSMCGWVRLNASNDSLYADAMGSAQSRTVTTILPLSSDRPMNMAVTNSSAATRMSAAATRVEKRGRLT